jgi:hypothetical protein
MLFVPVALILVLPVALAWWDWFKVADQPTWRKALSIVGLLLLTTVPILSVSAMTRVNQDQGVSPGVVHIEGWTFALSVSSIPFLGFGYRRARWLGIVSAIVLPFFTIVIDSLY